MAVDYFHRLVISGDAKNVRCLARALYREYPRTIAGKTWTEIAPFSFRGVYEIAPTARRISAEIPSDPYELRAWPVRRLPDGRAEARYQFQTRNMEMAPFVRLLARVKPQFVFTLVTECFDVGSIHSYYYSHGRSRVWQLPNRFRDACWEMARQKFGIAGDDVYDDDDAEWWADERMLAEALGHWWKPDDRARLKRYDWYNQPMLRDLDVERELAVVRVAEMLFKGGKKSTKPVRRKRRATAQGKNSRRD